MWRVFRIRLLELPASCISVFVTYFCMCRTYFISAFSYIHLPATKVHNMLQKIKITFYTFSCRHFPTIRNQSPQIFLTVNWLCSLLDPNMIHLVFTIITTIWRHSDEYHKRPTILLHSLLGYNLAISNNNRFSICFL